SAAARSSAGRGGRACSGARPAPLRRSRLDSRSRLAWDRSRRPMMHVVALPRGGGALGVRNRCAGAFDGRADVEFRERQDPDRMEADCVEAAGAEVGAECGVDAPPRLEALRERQSSRQLKDDEPVRTGGFDQPHYVDARESLARQVLEDEVRDDQVEGAGGWLVTVGEAEIGCIGVEAARMLEHAFGDVDPDGLVETAREGAGEPADAAAEVERALAPCRPAELSRGREHVLDLGLARGEERVELPATVPLGVDAENRPKRVDLGQVIPVSRLL